MRRTFILLTALAVVWAAAPLAASATTDDGCGSPFTPIYEIQGDGASSPYHGDTVTTEGVVTIDFQAYGQLGGYFLQDPAGDGDEATSDGIFVADWRKAVDVGDHIRITAEVDEQYGMTQLEYVSSVVVCGTGEVEATEVEVDEYVADTERYEGMYVEFDDKLTVTDTYNLYKYGEIWLADGKVIEQPTNRYPAGQAEDLALANMARKLLLDDGSNWAWTDPPPHLGDRTTIRLGDQVKELEGGVYYSYGQYRIQPAGDVEFKTKNKRPKAPDVDGDIVVTSANVLNYWTTLGGRGADDPDELQMQTDKLVAMLLGTDPDIIALQEIENDPAHTPILTLLDALNAADEEGDWVWMGEPRLPDGTVYYNEYPIRNEILYRSGSVEPVGDPVTIAHPAFDSERPDRPGPIGRPPVAQTFSVDGEVFTIMVNHFKSKGSPCDSIGDPADENGQANCNLTRVWQAETVLEFVDDLVEATGDPDVLVVGDLNSYLREDPILTLEEELVNLVSKYDKHPYSYNFFASFAFPWVGRGLIDHALATDAMADQVTDTQAWHVNADEPRLPNWDAYKSSDRRVIPYEARYFTPDQFRASDHDPIVIGIDLDDDHDDDHGDYHGDTDEGKKHEGKHGDDD